MKEVTLKERLMELSDVLMALPENGTERGTEANDGVYLASRVKKSTVEESLDMLRLQLKYLRFDLEATRRENRYLRQMLENRPPFNKDTSE